MLLHNIKVKVAEETVSDHLCVTIKNCAHIIHDHNPLAQFNWTISFEQDSSEMKKKSLAYEPEAHGNLLPKIRSTRNLLNV